MHLKLLFEISLKRKVSRTNVKLKMENAGPKLVLKLQSECQLSSEMSAWLTGHDILYYPMDCEFLK